MTQISVSQLSTRDWWLEEDVTRYASFGFQTLSVWREKLADYEMEQVTEWFAELDLKVSSLRWAGGFTGAECQSFEEALEDARMAIRQAACLNSPYLLIHSGARHLHTRKHSVRLFRSALEELVPVADDYGVQLITQPMPAEKGKFWTLLQTLESALDFCSCFDASSLGLSLDLDFWPDHREATNLDNHLLERVKLVQVSADRLFPAHEQRRLEQFGWPAQKRMEQLIRAGFDGVFEFELFGQPVESLTYASRLKHLRVFLEQQKIFARQSKAHE